MKQEKINYGVIMALGFEEETISDNVFFNEYGFDYTHITLKLTKKIYLDWAKETQLCELIRMTKPKTGDIGKRMPIKNLEHLKEIINFFSDEKEQEFDYTHVA